MVTTLILDGMKQSEMSNLYAMAIEEFERMLRAENCQIVNISSSDTNEGGFFSVKQTVTIVWTGTSNKINSTYVVRPNYGFFGGISSVNFHEC